MWKQRIPPPASSHAPALALALHSLSLARQNPNKAAVQMNTKAPQIFFPLFSLCNVCQSQMEGPAFGFA